MSSDLTFNKIAGGLLATTLAIVGLGELSNIVFKYEAPAKPGYAIAVQEASAGGEAEAPDVIPDWGAVLPTANVTAGATVAEKCKSCHNLDNGGPNLTGPNLYGVEGRTPGTHPGFAYSSAMQDFGKKNPHWTYDLLYQFLKGPQAYLSGTKMTFVGLKKPEDRINIIAYLRTQNASPPPIPAPNPKAAAAAKAPAPAAGGPAAGAAPAGAAVTGGASNTPGNTAPAGATAKSATPPAPTAATQSSEAKGAAPGGK